MGSSQDAFLEQFQAAFATYFGNEAVVWQGGQWDGNSFKVPGIAGLRRDGRLRALEKLELGDLRGEFRGFTLLVEYESPRKELPLKNLLKFWPYLVGSADRKPTSPIVICHFSDWWSYGTNRDLWAWLLTKMQHDTDRLVPVFGQQFDNGGPDNPDGRKRSISAALNWIDQVCPLPGGIVEAES